MSNQILEQLEQLWQNVLLPQSSLSVKRASAEQWQSLIHNKQGLPVDYLWPVIDYYHQYNLSYAKVAYSFTYVIYQANTAIAIWPINLITTEHGMKLLSNSGPILPPHFLSPEVSIKNSKKIAKLCLYWATKVAEFNHIQKLQTVNFSNFTATPHWELAWMSHGATISSHYENIVDLTMAPNEYKKHLSKGATADIKRSLKLWRFEHINNMSIEQRDMFCALHYKVAGKVTRSPESWESQRQLINQGVSFAVFAFSEKEQLIGAAQFIYSHDFATYAFGAYDRSLFHLPIAHGAQQLAIDYLQQRGIRSYLLGQRFFVGETPPPTAKECSIGQFKSSFANSYGLKHTFTLALSTSIYDE
ncbi:hypothetical protein [Motilimonas sp. 1_MG-2023]|uniref:hypothetical protein n=1 Tax=Motilimonas TaxID=1914248 RepID=UPI0026E406E6|nr:hypothetical protein [Motilimonas sp. 1_MG-2023]MDO6524964.1 hypothetical protein [Motilimonas sp. 1_MG-2023]